jgi:hypothetical protein
MKEMMEEAHGHLEEKSLQDELRSEFIESWEIAPGTPKDVVDRLMRNEEMFERHPPVIFGKKVIWNLGHNTTCVMLI